MEDMNTQSAPSSEGCFHLDQASSCRYGHCSLVVAWAVYATYGHALANDFISNNNDDSGQPATLLVRTYLLGVDCRAENFT